ncbi:MAG TPA: sigma-70 family RNA polymerase sigma factor [Planctomycetota bacterium]|nr:sigma-70 family RNA polymerase sigma factor [Planctomycetota bacterium]
MNPPHEELRSDSRRGLEELLVLELPALRSFVERLVRGMRPPVEAEDIVQETLARALRYRESFDPGQPAGPWLCKLALRLVIDSRASQRRDAEHRVEFARAFGHDVASDAAAECSAETLARWTARLSAVEREVLLRFHQGGESLREISMAMGLPEGTLKSHLHRGRKKLVWEDA